MKHVLKALALLPFLFTPSYAYQAQELKSDKIVQFHLIGDCQAEFIIMTETTGTGSQAVILKIAELTEQQIEGLYYMADVRYDLVLDEGCS